MIKGHILAILFFLLLSITNCSYSQSFNKRDLELIFAIDIFRHAARTPLYHINTLDNNLDYKPGILTQNGIHSSLLMGDSLRSYYLKNNLLNKVFRTLSSSKL